MSISSQLFTRNTFIAKTSRSCTERASNKVKGKTSDERKLNKERKSRRVILFEAFQFWQVVRQELTVYTPARICRTPHPGSSNIQ